MAATAARRLREAGLHGHLVPTGPDGASGSAPTVVEPVLAATFAAAQVHGAQGRTSGRSTAIGHDNVAAVASLGVWPEGQWHERTLRTFLLAAGEAAVRAGAAVVVPSPAGNAAVPAHTDGSLLQDLLRREWRFTGIVLAHPGAVDALDRVHQIAGGPEHAVALALEAGVDVMDAAAAAARRIVDLVRSGAVSSWLVDDAVTAVLTLKFRLGLLARPDGAHVPPPSAAGPDEDTLVRLSLLRSALLLADPAAVLPLTSTRVLEVVSTDPAVPPDDPSASTPDVQELVRALKAQLPATLVRAGPVEGSENAADTVVVLGREPVGAVSTAEAVVASGRRCVVLVTSDRIGDLDLLAATTATVLVGWRPVGAHADVLAGLLTGRDEPGGRLPVALPAPAAPGSRTGTVFPLGHGTGYTTFGYSRLDISPAVLDGGDVVRVQCSVTNTGARHGREVVQVYLDNPTGRTITTPGPALAAYAAVEVAAGQTLHVTIRVPLARLAVWNRTMHHILEPGTVEVLVGRSAADIRLRGTVTIAPQHPYGQQ